MPEASWISTLQTGVRGPGQRGQKRKGKGEGAPLKGFGSRDPPSALVEVSFKRTVKKEANTLAKSTAFKKTKPVQVFSTTESLGHG
jgi:hypothetical protein